MFEGESNMGLLPDRFLRWNYFGRGKMLRDMVQPQNASDMNRFFLESTRHNPALCTAFKRDDGSTLVNAKIVGIGYVLNEGFIEDAIKAFGEHVEYGDKLFKKARARDEKENAAKEYRKDGISLLLKHLYFENYETAKVHVDFSKMATVELALSKPNSSKHTWQIVQHNRNACLLFYQPPSISFEIHGKIELHENDIHQKFVNLVHDAFHYVQPENRKQRRPVYIFHVEETFDNSASSEGFGKKLV